MSSEERPGNRKTFESLPGGGYALTLVDEAVRLEIRHLRREHHQLVGELDVRCEWAGARTYQGSLTSADLNLSSLQARTQRAKHCEVRAKTKPDDFDWFGAIDEFCRRCLEAERLEEPAQVLDDVNPLSVPDFEVAGLRLPADGPALLIAHGDSLKSLILLLVLGLLAQRGTSVLYLDWEWTGSRHLARKKRLFGKDRLEGLCYLRLHAPLEREAERLARYCEAHAVEYLAVDSVGLAAAGKLNDDDSARDLYRALRGLPPALCAAHVSKAAIMDDKTHDQVGPYGSVFFSNLCRASWTVRKQVQDVGGDLVTVGLFPQKQNDGARTAAIGLEFTFSAAAIQWRPVALTEVDGLADRLPLATRIAEVLKTGAQTYVTLAEQLGAKVNSVIQATNRNTKFVKVLGADGITRIGLADKVH